MIDLNWKDLGMNKQFVPMIEQAVALNCASEKQMGATDKALDEFIVRCQADKAALIAKHLPTGDKLVRFPFNSTRKRMSTIIENATGKGGYDKRMFIKGAPEYLIPTCNRYIDENGTVQSLTDNVKGSIDNIIATYGSQALRCIMCAYKDVQPNEGGPKHSDGGAVKDIEQGGFTIICIFGIKDIVRASVPGAVLKVQQAGVTVRMVTGDNIITAQAIAEECNIITAEEKGNPRIAMEGKTFFEMTGGLFCKNCDKDIPADCKCEQVDRIEVVKNAKVFKDLVPTFKVMARARPEDKYLLVTGLKNLRFTVAVTGDGTNDAPALKKSDVGFAMGITGTEVA